MAREGEGTLFIGAEAAARKLARQQATLSTTISLELNDRIAHAAVDCGVPKATLARHLLEKGMEEYDKNGA